MRDRTSIQRTAHEHPGGARSCQRQAHAHAHANALRSSWLLGVFLAACGGEDGPSGSGTLVIPFELGNDRSCESVGVASVRAELKGTDYEAEADCTAGQVRIKNVPAGSYGVSVFALDENGVEVMDNVSSGQSTANVSGEGRTDVFEPAVTLTAAPAHLKVRWNFSFSSCKGAGIDTFDVKAWRGTGDSLIVKQTLPCTLEGEGRGGYRDIDDPERRFGGDVGGEVSVQPYDKDKVPVGKAVVFKFKAPGAGHDVKVTVECNEGSCSGSGKPDAE